MSETNTDYHVLAYYFFTHLEDPQLEVARHKEFLKDQDIRCRLYISEEGDQRADRALPQILFGLPNSAP